MFSDNTDTFLCLRQYPHTIVVAFVMNFWENVEYVREYKGISRKELAYKAHFSLNSISTGITRGSFPAVDVAFRIAQVLGTTVETLLNEDIFSLNFISAKKQIENENQIQQELSIKMQTILKYTAFIEDFSKIPADMQKTLGELIHKIADGVESTPASSVS